MALTLLLDERRATGPEGGLAVLAPTQWAPRLTPDRLAAAMRLSADCGLVQEDNGRFEFES